MNSVIDEDGYRECIGIIIVNRRRNVFWGKRLGHLDAWQFPQGGVFKHEIPEEALFRELWEEVGLQPNHVRVIAKTVNWLTYDLPKEMVRQGRLPLCKGQKQQWFLLELLADDDTISFDSTASPEFDKWRWVDYWFPLRRVVPFKRNVYRQALREFAPHVFKGIRYRTRC